MPNNQDENVAGIRKSTGGFSKLAVILTGMRQKIFPKAKLPTAIQEFGCSPTADSKIVQGLEHGGNYLSQDPDI
jgi:hypothetical protein